MLVMNGNHSLLFGIIHRFQEKSRKMQTLLIFFIVIYNIKLSAICGGWYRL